MEKMMEIIIVQKEDFDKRKKKSKEETDPNYVGGFDRFSGAKHKVKEEKKNISDEEKKATVRSLQRQFRKAKKMNLKRTHYSDSDK